MSISNPVRGFEVKLDVSDFAQEEITVKTDDRYITIIAEHEEQLNDQGFIARHFIRRYLLPSDIQTDAISSSLSQDGILTITAPAEQVAVKYAPDDEKPSLSEKKPETHYI
ncbi:protein lethal(2)essential for life-like [Stegodyphus dumicola]|uniref:protein lethal(2)essential for life-like n=1 Tax=Stegodyphus dumicola TaxID=202533 RepID=UPI0015ADEEE0|nr:protein lethal(2)essential for life-like [Stegodyphus dumicola]